MNRRDVQLPDDGGIVQAEHIMFDVSLGSMRPETFVAELLLLSEGLVTELSLRHPAQEAKVRLSIVETDARAAAAVSAEGLRLGLSRSELESWIAFFLRYYRDGAAEVDHLDLEANHVGHGVETIDLVLRVGTFRPPVSSDEARRRLGLR